MQGRRRGGVGARGKSEVRIRRKEEKKEGGNEGRGGWKKGRIMRK